MSQRQTGRTMYDDRMEKRDSIESARATRLTYDDFLLFPDDGRRHEIIDGEHFVTPRPNTRHQALVGRLYFEVELFLRQHSGAGRIFMAPLDVLLTRWDVVEPDLIFIAGDQADILTDKNVQGAPALAIEIMSKGTRKTDEQVKRRLFARGGVREYLADRSRARHSQGISAPPGWFVPAGRRACTRADADNPAAAGTRDSVARPLRIDPSRRTSYRRRRATRGSTLAARQAGERHAARPTTISSPTVPPKATGSAGLKPASNPTAT